MAVGLILTSCKGKPASGQEGASGNPQGTSEVVTYESKPVPKLSVYIDETAEGYSTIEEMQTDYFHEAKCTGTLDLDVPEDQDNNPEVKLIVDESMTLKAGESCYLDVDFDAGNSLPRNFRFVFNSKDEDVVTVDENGLVTAVAPGEATIVIRPTRGGINYDRVSVEVKVK